MFKFAAKGLSLLVLSLSNFHYWSWTGYLDIVSRYARTKLGPWWGVINASIFIFLITMLWSSILNVQIVDYLIYLSVGYIVWLWISTQIIESSQGYVPYLNIVKQTYIPFYSFIFRISVRNFIVLLHNFLIIIFALIYKGHFDFYFGLISFFGLCLVFLNIFFLMTIVSLLSSRFSDVGAATGTFVQLAFFFTPVIWLKEAFKGKTFFIELNPFYNWIEIVRSPLLGEVPTLYSYSFATFSFIFLMFISFVLYGKYEKRIVFWI